MKDFKDMNDVGLLKELKADTVAWFEYWNENIRTYHKAKNFLFYSNLSTKEKHALNDLQRPPLEFNILEAYVSRLTGEFSKQEPNFNVHESPDAQVPTDTRAVTIIEGHVEAIAEESKKEGSETLIYKDMLAGGYSAGEIFYEYASPTSFNQNIKFRKVKDPTMCGWDPLAQDLHKGDGRFCFRVFPMTEREFSTAYPNVDISSIAYNAKSVGKFSFSYQAKNEKILAVCVYYGKIKSRKKIVYLANDICMSQSEYNKMMKEWDNMGFIEQPPKIIKSRMTEFTKIMRYDFIENQILDKSETLYTELPTIFFDGNSTEIRESDGEDDLKQTVRPYWKNAEGAQRLKNLAGQALANDIESMVMHKFKAAKEGIPKGYEQFYINNQKAGVLVYNAFMPDGITQIPPPQEVMRQPIPPEVLGIYAAADQTTQSCLGSYDSALGINDNELSGKAIIEGGMASNMASMPYVRNFMISWNQAAKIIMGLMPKVLKNPRQIPIINKKKQRQYVKINMEHPESVSMKFDPNTMNLVVEAGVNFEVQKNQSLQMMSLLSKSFASLAQLINTKGLPILLDNVTFRGSDQLKQLADQMMQEIQQQQQKQANTPPPPNPLELKAEELNLKRQKMQQDAQIESAKIANERVEMNLKAHMQGRQDAIQVAKMKTEESVHHAKNLKDLAVSSHKIASDHSIAHAKHALDYIDKTNDLMDKAEKASETSVAPAAAPTDSQLTTAPENPNHG